MRARTRIGRYFAIGLAILCLVVAQLHTNTAYAATPGQLTLTVNQAFSSDGSAQPPSDNFSYQLTAQTADAPMPAGATSSGYDFDISGTGQALLGPIQYAKPGIYTYGLSCVTPATAGYTIDSQVYSIEVIVTTDLSVASVVYLSNGDKTSDISFEHYYGTLPTKPADMLDVPVVKKVNGTPTTASVFMFNLEAQKATYPMPSGSQDGVDTITITGPGQATFGTWSYSQAGVYVYTVAEANTGITGYAYDSSVYTITDTVTDENGQLVLSRVVTDKNGTQVDACSFTNTYMDQSNVLSTGDNPQSSGGGTTSTPNFVSTGNSPFTGDTSNPMLWVILSLSSCVLLALIILLYKRAGRRQKDR